MVLQHSPSRQQSSQDQTSIITTTASPRNRTMPVTLETIASMIDSVQSDSTTTKASIDELKSTMDDTMKKVLERIENVEASIRTQATRTNFIEHDIDLIREDIESIKTTKSSVNDIKDVIRESQMRIAKQCNLVFMGVPENHDAINTVKAILHIILPDFNLNIDNNRLGNVDTSKLPRPMRIPLSTLDERRLALRNCRKLKGHPEFKGISVKPDLTKRQISLLNEKRAGQNTTGGSQIQQTSTTGSGPGARNKRKSQPIFNFQSTSRPRMDSVTSDPMNMD
jgi:prefoldin subunit 5